MTAPISMGRPALPPDNILAAPTTPGKRLPVVDRTKVDPQLLKAAEGMEAMFLDYMLKVMRQTVPKNELDLESPATGIYRGMLDTETAQRAAKAGGIGLADQIIAYLQPQGYNQNQGPKSPLAGQRKVGQVTPETRSTGGTYEGRSVRQQSSSE